MVAGTTATVRIALRTALSIDGARSQVTVGRAGGAICSSRRLRLAGCVTLGELGLVPVAPPLDVPGLGQFAGFNVHQPVLNVGSSLAHGRIREINPGYGIEVSAITTCGAVRSISSLLLGAMGTGGKI